MTGPPTLADLAADPGELIVWCMDCHHNAVLPVAPVPARHGSATPFPEGDGQVPLFGVRRQVDVRRTPYIDVHGSHPGCIQRRYENIL
jgi:hypothetical protein